MIKLLMPAFLLAASALGFAQELPDTPSSYKYFATKPTLDVLDAVTAPGDVVVKKSLSLSATALDFGHILAGRTSSIRSVLVLNEGNTPASIANINVAGPFTASHNCPSQLEVGQSCAANLTYKPLDAGSHEGALTVQSDAGTRSVTLKGTAAESVTAFSTDSLFFGSSLVPNVATTRTIYLNNEGKATAYGAVAVSGPGYSLASSGTSCNLAGGTLASNTRCAITVQLLPTEEGTVTGDLRMTVAGQDLSATLQGKVITPTVAFSGSNSSYTTPGNNILVANTLGITTTGTSSVNVERIYVRPVNGGAKTYTMTLTGDPRLSFFRVSSHHNSLSQEGGAANASGYSLTYTTPNSYIVARPFIQAVVTEPGTHILQSQLHVTSSDGTVDMSIPVTVEMRYDVAVVGQRMGTDNFGSTVERAEDSVTNLGVTSANVIQEASPPSVGQRFYVVASGTQGNLKGRWSLSGDTGFKLSGIRKDQNTISDSCGATISADGQSTTDCVSGGATSNNYPHQSVYVAFAPATAGVKTATLTFTPDAATGLAPSTFKLQGEGRHDITTALQSGGSFRYNESTPYVAGSVNNMGTVASGSTLRRLTYASSLGTYGKLKGTWSLTGSPSFTLRLSEQISNSANSGSACGVVNADKRSTTACTGDSRQGNSYVHLRTQVEFTHAIGTHTATLTFTPDPTLGLAPLSMQLQATGN